MILVATLAAALLTATARGWAHSAKPHLTGIQVKAIARAAARPYLDESSPTQGLPFTVSSVRLVFGSRGDRIWVVRMHAHYFRWPCPRSPSTALPCVDSPSEYAVVHIRDATAIPYSVRPIANP